MTDQEIQHLKLLAPYVEAGIKSGKTVEDSIINAFRQLGNTASEMAMQDTPRSKRVAESMAVMTFAEHRKMAISIVKTWPAWKRAIIGGIGCE